MKLAEIGAPITGRLGRGGGKTRGLNGGPTRPIGGRARRSRSNEAGGCEVAMNGPFTSGCLTPAGIGAAKLNIASRRPPEQKMKARKMRGVKKPDLELRFFFMR